MREGLAAIKAFLPLWVALAVLVSSAQSSRPFPADDSSVGHQTASRRIFGPLDFLPLLARIRGALRDGRRETEQPYSLFRFPRLFAPPPSRVKSTEEEIAEYVRDYIRARIRERQREKNTRNLREGRRTLNMLKKQTGGDF